MFSRGGGQNARTVQSATRKDAHLRLSKGPIWKKKRNVLEKGKKSCLLFVVFVSFPSRLSLEHFFFLLPLFFLLFFFEA